MFELIPRFRSIVSRPERDIFDWAFDGFDLPEVFRAEKGVTPAFDISETDNEIHVKAELPGMNPNEIEITLTGDLLTIKGEKKEEKEEKGKNFHRRERRYGSFSRSFRLPVEVKADSINAGYKDGVLTVTVPKAEEEKARRIEVTS
jgi:HSP20 family protein